MDSPNYGYETRTSKMAVFSLVFGILSLLLSLLCLSILSVPGVICGHMALSQIKQSGGSLGGHGVAVAGLVTSYIGLALSIFLLPLLMAIAVPNFVKARTVAQAN